LLLLIGGAPAPFRAARAAEDPVKAAQRKTQEGARQLEQGHADHALRLFQEAYTLTENARYQYNIGVASSALGREVEALEAFEKFAAEARGITREHRRDAEAKIDALRRKIAELEVSSNESGVELRLDGQRLGWTPLAKPVRANIGSHVVSASKSGFQPFERRIELTRGTRTRLEVVLSPVPSPLAPPPMTAAAAPPRLKARPEPEPRIQITPKRTAPEESSSGRVWLWAGLGAVVVAGVVVGVLLATRGGNDNPSCPPGVDGCVGR
jgi:hypothetical protein